MAKSKSEQALKRWQRNYLPHIIGIGESLHSAERVSGAAWKYAMSAILEAMKGKAFDGSILSEDMSKKPKSFGVIKLIDLIEYVEGEE